MSNVTIRDRIQLNIVVADSSHEKALSEFILGAHDLPVYVPSYRAELQDLFKEAKRIRKPRGLWQSYK